MYDSHGYAPSPNQARFLHVLRTQDQGECLADLCHKAGITPETLFRWFDNPHFSLWLAVKAEHHLRTTASLLMLLGCNDAIAGDRNAVKMVLATFAKGRSSEAWTSTVDYLTQQRDQHEAEFGPPKTGAEAEEEAKKDAENDTPPPTDRPSYTGCRANRVARQGTPPIKIENVVKYPPKVSNEDWPAHWEKEMGYKIGTFPAPPTPRMDGTIPEPYKPATPEPPPNPFPAADVERAARTGDIDYFRNALSRGWDVDTTLEELDGRFSTALMIAAQYGQNSLAIFLLNAHADQTFTDRNGHTPLKYWEKGLQDRTSNPEMGSLLRRIDELRNRMSPRVIKIYREGDPRNPVLPKL